MPCHANKTKRIIYNNASLEGYIREDVAANLLEVWILPEYTLKIYIRDNSTCHNKSHL